ncbi:hypothetical protein PO124_01130 [Bacillus licheniformis]|nr:hypothetical protein [Bacillus licheniformis]
MIDHMGHIKVTDFGIAMALSSTTITHTNSVWALSIICRPNRREADYRRKIRYLLARHRAFELLTARMPFEGESAVSIALKHLQSETPSVKDGTRPCRKA